MKRIVFTACSFLLLAFASANAKAAIKYDCQIVWFAFYGISATIACSDGTTATMMTDNGPTTCVEISPDSFKVYTSIVQSAFLAGRKIDLGYNTQPAGCSGYYVTQVTLK